MSKFQKGDAVLVNRNVVAEIDYYHEGNDDVRYVERPQGGGTNTVTAKISQLTIEPLSPVQDVAHSERDDVHVKGASDEVTTTAVFAPETEEEGDARVNARPRTRKAAAPKADDSNS